MRVGITATRNGLSKKQFHDMCDWLLDRRSTIDCILHGDCIGGDAEVDTVARTMDLAITTYPCTIENQRAHCEKWGPTNVHDPMPPLERNHVIVDECDILLVFPKSMQEELRSGTWATYRYAQKMNKPVVMFWPERKD